MIPAACFLALLISTVYGFSTYSYGIDIYDPEEDVAVQVDVFVDASNGATSSMAVTNFSTPDGRYDTTLIRNDLNELYFILPRFGAVGCFAFKLGGAYAVPQMPSNAQFAKLPVIGTASLAGTPLQHRRLSLPGGYQVGAMLNLASGYPAMVSDTEGDGTLQFFRDFSTSKPDASIFAVPDSCGSSERVFLETDVSGASPGAMPAPHTLQSNLDVIASHALPSYTLAPNRFLGLDFATFSHSYLMPPLSHSDLMDSNVLNGVPVYTPSASVLSTLPQSIDRSAQGFTTPIRDQSMCGGCWTFATTAAMETNTAVKYGTLTTLAPQNFLDCVPAGTGLIAAKGCNGGWPLTAMQYANSTGGVATEASYPFALVDGNCNASVPHVSPLSGFGAIAQGNTTAIMAAVVQYGSVVGIMQVLGDFVFFTNGIYSNPACTGAVLSHAVTIVGYGTDASSGMDYWIIKNSFGKAWGAAGYFRMQKGVNMCGIENWGAVPYIA